MKIQSGEEEPIRFPVSAKVMTNREQMIDKALFQIEIKCLHRGTNRKTWSFHNSIRLSLPTQCLHRKNRIFYLNRFISQTLSTIQLQNYFFEHSNSIVDSASFPSIFSLSRKDSSSCPSKLSTGKQSSQQSLATLKGRRETKISFCKMDVIATIIKLTYRSTATPCNTISPV